MTSLKKTIDFKEVVEAINNSDNIFIASHINPDGDNLGSMLALYLALKKLGEKVRPLEADFLPEDFMFLPGASDIEAYDESQGEIDLLILLDSSDEDRLGDNKDLLARAKRTVNIDHHISNNKFADINIVDPSAAATGELIYMLLLELGVELDEFIAENIYTAISTDTGKFSYDSVTSDTHRIVAELIDAGADFNKINLNLYESMGLLKMKLHNEALATLTLYEDNKVGIIKVSQKMLEKTGTSMEDTNGLVEQVRKIKGIEVACLLKEEKKNKIKVSMRSKEYCDVASICNHFGGGGHVRAAGCSINESLNKSEVYILEEIKKCI